MVEQGETGGEWRSKPPHIIWQNEQVDCENVSMQMKEGLNKSIVQSPRTAGGKNTDRGSIEWHISVRLHVLLLSLIDVARK